MSQNSNIKACASTCQRETKSFHSNINCSVRWPECGIHFDALCYLVKDLTFPKRNLEGHLDPEHHLHLSSVRLSAFQATNSVRVQKGGFAPSRADASSLPGSVS